MRSMGVHIGWIIVWVILKEGRTQSKRVREGNEGPKWKVSLKESMTEVRDENRIEENSVNRIPYTGLQYRTLILRP